MKCAGDTSFRHAAVPIGPQARKVGAWRATFRFLGVFLVFVSLVFPPFPGVSEVWDQVGISTDFRLRWGISQHNPIRKS